jgi:hypothetical protein
MDETIELMLMTNLGRVPTTPFRRGDFSLRILFWGRVVASIFKRPGSGNQAGFLPAAGSRCGRHHSRDKKYLKTDRARAMPALRHTAELSQARIRVEKLFHLTRKPARQRPQRGRLSRLGESIRRVSTADERPGEEKG